MLAIGLVLRKKRQELRYRQNQAFECLIQISQTNTQDHVSLSLRDHFIAKMGD